MLNNFVPGISAEDLEAHLADLGLDPLKARRVALILQKPHATPAELALLRGVAEWLRGKL